MRIPEYSHQHKVAFNMTPMIDVVFLLIIFFLVSSHLAQRENRIPMELPVANSGEEDIASDHPRVTINVESESKMSIGGQIIATSDLSSRLTQAQDQMGETMELRIRCNRNVPYRSVAPIMRTAAELGIWNVTYAVVQRRDER